MEQKKRIWVAVGVIENERGDIFIARRSSDRPGGSLPVARWSPVRIALDREEEIGIRVDFPVARISGR